MNRYSVGVGRPAFNLAGLCALRSALFLLAPTVGYSK